MRGVNQSKIVPKLLSMSFTVGLNLQSHLKLHIKMKIYEETLVNVDEAVCFTHF